LHLVIDIIPMKSIILYIRMKIFRSNLEREHWGNHKSNSPTIIIIIIILLIDIICNSAAIYYKVRISF
jgi:hypothetical protein